MIGGGAPPDTHPDHTASPSNAHHRRSAPRHIPAAYHNTDGPGDAAFILLMLPGRFIPCAGGLLAWILSFALYFALVGFFFDLDPSDTWFLVVVVFGLKLATFVALMYLG